MTLIPIKCPCCGADIKVNQELEKCQCTYCGSTFFVKAAEAFYNASISGTVQVRSADFVIRAGALEEYHGESREVVIPSNVAVIGKKAFKGALITKVTIPDSVTSIGQEAFWDCTSLESITIGNSVSSIGGYAFRGCTSLKSITIPGSVKEIGEMAFDKCTSLESITIPDSVKTINACAFRDCSSLTTVILPQGLTEIKDCAFDNCKALAQMRIPSSIRYIGRYVFRDCTSLPLMNTYGASHDDDAFSGWPAWEAHDRKEREWRNKGLCQHCGGCFSGFFSLTCSRCGRKKDY